MPLSEFIPKYQQLYNSYKSRILANELVPGARIDSINRIIQKHKVSRDTAKRVLKKLTEEGFVVSVVGKGSFVAPQSQIQPKWGMIIPFISPNIEIIISELIIKARQHQREFTHLFHYNNPEEETTIVGNMIRQGYEAIIIVPNYNENLTADFYRNLITGKTKVILADNTMAGSYFNYVIQSYDLGIKRALNYFEGKNDLNILFVKEMIWQNRNLLQEHMEQSLYTMLQANPNRKAFVIDNASILSAEFITQNKIGNILTSIDRDAIQIVGRLKEWNIKVPEEITVVNYGNTEITRYFSPAITVVDCNYTEMCNKITELIFLPQNSPLVQHVIAPKLIIRNT